MVAKPKLYEDRTGKKYVITSVMIEYELYKNILKLVDNYGRGKGWLSYFVNEALRAYLAPRMHTQKHTNPVGKVKRVFQSILECLREFEGGAYVPDEVPAKKLRVCIAEVRGSDPRTIEKWIGIFLKQGLIKDLTPSNPPNRKIYEIVVI